MSDQKTVVTQMTLSPAMHAAVLDSLGADPAAFAAGELPDRSSTVEAGLAQLEEASLLVRDGEVMVIHPLVQEIVLSTIDPQLVIRCVVSQQGESAKTTSVFARGLGPVAYAGPSRESGARSYRIYDSWDEALDSLVAWFELPEIAARDTEATLPTEQAAAWLDDPAGAEPPAELGIGEVRSVGNIAMVAMADGVAEDGRNIAVAATDDECWLVAPDDSDPAVSSIRAGNADVLFRWLHAALGAE